MNVRFYMERAQRANRALLDSFGLYAGRQAGQKSILVQKDSYVRYHREQFQGSTLAVKGGVLEAGEDDIRLYFELVNDAKAEVAATFIMAVGLVDLATRTPLPMPQRALAAADRRRVTLPEHGRPRTIDLGAPRLDLAFEDLAARLTEDHQDPFSRRMERVIDPAECDAFGFLREGQDMMFGGFRMPRPDTAEAQFGPMTFVSEEGRRFGWASMETRHMRVSQPRAGDALCSISAEIGLKAKIRHSRRWMFNTTTGALVSLNDNVNIALDLDARRSIEIPPTFRRQLEQRHTPEFA
jgi:acyl-CoA thioesterase FadM